MKWLVRTTTAIFLGCCMIIIAAVVLFGASNNCGPSGPPVTAPGAGTQTAGQIVRYFESLGIAPNGSAGIVGNLQQESSLNPLEPDGGGGGGLAQWSATWYHVAGQPAGPSLDAFAQSAGLSASSGAAQLAYIVSGLRNYYQQLLGKLNSAASPGLAADYFQNGYEHPGTPMQANRELYATMALAAAGGGATAMPVSFVTGTACAASGPIAAPGGYLNPLSKASGITWERTDQGVDASMAVGSPILALGTCTVKLIVSFYAGQPAIVCELLNGQLAGDWWYTAEQITPIVTVGETVQAGQQIATYAPTGTAIETGWWQPNGGYPLGHDSYNDGSATLAGADFRFLLNQLGARAGTGAGLSSGTTLGTTDYP